jgi:SAM-dependent methyltransferase
VPAGVTTAGATAAGGIAASPGPRIPASTSPSPPASTGTPATAGAAAPAVAATGTARDASGTGTATPATPATTSPTTAARPTTTSPTTAAGPTATFGPTTTGGPTTAGPTTAGPTTADPTTAAGPTTPGAGTAVPDAARDGLFARHTHAYAAGHAGQQITVLHAGCATAGDLGTGELAAGGADISVTSIDEDRPAIRAAMAASGRLDRCVLGDLRGVPLPPRAFDIVQCSSLLERISNAELVLDRLTAAIKPGGLLLLRFCDRDSAAGFLDRALPLPLRRMVWRRRRPGQPGPLPAVYDRLASARGVQAYSALRGLVVAERLALGGLSGGLPAGPYGFLACQRLLARLTGGRLTADHEELLYVLRKPENRFARVL